jgi:serine/threonine protein kinase
VSRTATSDRFLSGARLGDYKIDKELRSEETGIVYLADHVVLPRRAAVKVMRGGEMWLREMAVAVVREACVLEPLDHPGIPRVYECGVLADKRPWIAFEPLEGVTVAASLDDGHVMPIENVAAMLRDVAEILAYIHAEGVVHRLITASSIVRRSSTAKFPFVLRNWSDAYTPEIELPPGLVDPSDDIHALGMVAYRALTGELAAPGNSATTRRAGAPVELAALIDEMVADDRAARPTAKQVRERAAMIAAMTALVPSLATIEKPRWTPVYGIDPSKTPSAEMQAQQVEELPQTSELTITIRQTRH